MKILGLDPSLTDFGYAVIDTNLPPDEMLIESGRWKTTSKDFEVLRYMSHRESLRSLISEHGTFDFIGVEAPPFGASYSEGLYALSVYVREALFQKRQDYVLFMPSQVKAYARDILNDTGKMHKSDMVEAARRVLGGYIGRLNHNIADAVLIGHMAYQLKALLEGDLQKEQLGPKLKKSFYGPSANNKTGTLYKEDDRYFMLSSLKYDPLYRGDH